MTGPWMIRPRTPDEVFEAEHAECDWLWMLHIEQCRPCRVARTAAAACPEGRDLYRAAAKALADYLFFVRGEGGVPS